MKSVQITTKFLGLAIVFTMVSVVFSLTPAWGMTAQEIMEKADQREDGDTVIAETVMVLVDKRNNQRVRQMKRFEKDFGKDSKSVVFFSAPADVRNTAFLSYDWDDEAQDDDSWLYLPALKKVKRIASSDKSGSFMGSDFTYSDISGLDINDWQYKFDKTPNQIESNKEVWVILGAPKKNKAQKVIEETGYLKSKVWVRKDNFMIVKGKFWVKKGRKIKYLTVKDIRLVDGIWTGFEVRMITTKRGKMEHGSILKTNSILYNQKLQLDMFSTQRMTRGI